jgi:hypothetical protein
MRPSTLLLCLALAGSASANAAGPEHPTAAAHPSVVPGHNANASAQKEDRWKEGGVTREKINAMCWMKYENGRKDLPIDTRADLVNKCVAETLKKYPVH